jgi:hypothetical protein
MKKLLIIIILCATAIATKAPDYHRINLVRPKVVKSMDSPARWLDAIIKVENGTEYNSREPEAVGILQQHPIFVDDVNRIIKQKKYSYNDRLDKKKAIEMFFIFQAYYNPEMNFEKMCKIQVAGPNGMKKKCSEKYYFAVRDKLFENNYKN